MEIMGPVKMKDVHAAQQRIVEVVRKLEEEGVINIGGGGDEICRLGSSAATTASKKLRSRQRRHARPQARAILGQDHMMNVEKQAFEQGYQEGERIGKQMGERMMETAVKRYERSMQRPGTGSSAACRSPWKSRRFSSRLQIARKIIQREVDDGS